MKLEFSRQIFEKYSNIKFHENPSSGSRVVPYGQTDRHDAADSRFRNFANAPKNELICYIFTIFYDDVNTSDYMASNVWMIGKKWTVRDIKGGDGGLIEVQSGDLIGLSYENETASVSVEIKTRYFPNTRQESYLLNPSDTNRGMLPAPIPCPKRRVITPVLGWQRYGKS